MNRGVTVHRKDCRHFLQLDGQQVERIIDVCWGQDATDNYPIDISIEAYDRTGLLSDISGMLANMRVNVVNVQTQSDKSKNIAYMRLTVEVSSIDELAHLLARLNNLPNVISAMRSKNH